MKRQYLCEARLSPTPDKDPEPLYRCLRAEHDDPAHEWSAGPYWLPQKSPQPIPIKVLALSPAYAYQKDAG